MLCFKSKLLIFGVEYILDSNSNYFFFDKSVLQVYRVFMKFVE